LDSRIAHSGVCLLIASGLVGCVAHEPITNSDPPPHPTIAALIGKSRVAHCLDPRHGAQTPHQTPKGGGVALRKAV
jgi:hypothetical protein